MSSLEGSELDYLDKGDAQDRVLEQMADKASKHPVFVRNYGTRQWRLLSGFKSLVDNYESMVHGMELPTGVLVKSLEMRGGGGISSSFQMLDGYVLVEDEVGDGIYRLELGVK